MKKIFLLLAFVLLIPLTAMAADASNLKDSKWIIEKANQSPLLEIDFNTINEETPLAKLPGDNNTFMVAESHVKDFLEFYDFDADGQLQAILLLTPNEKSHQKIEKSLIRSLGAPISTGPIQKGWLQSKNMIVSFYDNSNQLYIIAIMDISSMPPKDLKSLAK